MKDHKIILSRHENSFMYRSEKLSLIAIGSSEFIVDLCELIASLEAQNEK